MEDYINNAKKIKLLMIYLMNEFATNIWNSFIMYFIYTNIFYSVYRIIIMHQAMSLITKKLIAQNLPYFYQNSLKIFINLTDCWKKNMATM